MGSCPGVGQASPDYLNGLQARYHVAMRASRHFIGAGAAKLRSLRRGPMAACSSGSLAAPEFSN